jgi:nucleoside-diphosphate-sugar epimerase
VVKRFKHNNNFRFENLDISLAMPQSSGRIDLVFHLAARVSAAESVTEVQKNHRVNETGFINVLDFCKKNSIRKLVYASSAAVYGASDQLSCQENDKLEPASPYGLSKVHNENYARLFAQLFDIKTIGLRFFNVYGPGQRHNSPYSGVITKFITSMLSEKG